MSKVVHRLLIVVMVFTSLVGTAAVAQSKLQTPSSNSITLQLRWTPQFQFAGYYAALWQGYYQAAGLDVQIIPGSPSKQPHAEVLAGRAQYGVGNSEVLLSYLQNKPLIALSAIVQHSPSVLLTRKDSGIRTPQDLIGKNVMVLGGANDVEFLALLTSEGVRLQDVNILPSSFRIDDLIEGKVDAFNAYLSNEPFYLQDQGITPHVINPVDYGVDMYSDILFTSQQEVEQHPKRVHAFLEASLKGWEYALTHQQEIIDRLLSMPNIGKTRQQLENEAKVLYRLIQPDIVPIGNINPGRFDRLALHLQEFGFIDEQRNLAGFIYDPTPTVRQSTFFKVMGLSLAGLVTFFLMALWFWQNNRRLQKEISLRQETERSLKNSKQHFKRIVESMQEVYYRVDEQGVIQYISPAVEEVMHASVQEMIGKPIESFYAPGFCRQDLLDKLQANGGHIKNYELKVVRADQCEIWIATNSQNYYENNQVKGIEGTFREITLQKSQQEQMQALAFEDPLTHLYNRRSLIKRLNISLRNCQQQNLYGALLFMDLDDFKPINDQYGHAIGDQLLQAVAKRLKNSVRQNDAIFRIGGDEFVILLSYFETKDRANAERNALKIAEHLLEKLRAPYPIENLALTVAASLGVKIFHDGSENAQTLIEQADQGMYQAKKHGKNQIQLI